MRVLVLDDDTERLAILTQRFEEMKRTDDDVLDMTQNADQAIEYLSENEYDIVCLDHDLGGHFVHPYDESEKTGMYVVKAVVAQGVNENACFIIHSWNSVGAKAMAALLRDFGYTVVVSPFSTRTIL
jgi:CheY-like chemotaxis protein